MEDMQPTLGEIVNTLIGINSSYYGPNASRPVIRGLDGDRVQILQNGLASFDASGTSADHAVAIDTLTARRIEVVRGPAVLLYGPTAIGGVVNVIDTRIPYERVEGAAGGVDLRYASPARERAAAGFLEFGTQQGLQFHVDGFKRRTDDLRIADYAYSPQLRATLPPDDQGPFGTLPNSASDSDGGSLGVAYVGAKGFAGASYTQFDSTYGTVAEPDVTIKMKQERVDVAAQWLAPVDRVKSIDFKFVDSRYQHTEFEGSEVGTVFKNDGYQGRLDVVHDRIGALEGAFGVQTVDFDFSALGAEGFLPPTSTRSYSAFVYEEARMDRWRFSFGARYDYTRISASEGEAFGPALTRTFNSGAISLGAAYSLTPEVSLVGSLAYTQRPPNYQELFADGPHIATGIVEVGDRNFGLEKSVGVDVALRRKGNGWSGSVGAFYNRFADYITLYNSGALDPDSGLPIYNYLAAAAQFYGIEAEGKIALGEYGPGRFDLELQADYLWAANTDVNQPLPRISPVRFGGALVYLADRWDARNHVSYLVDIAPMGARGVTVGVRGTF